MQRESKSIHGGEPSFSGAAKEGSWDENMRMTHG